MLFMFISFLRLEKRNFKKIYFFYKKCQQSQRLLNTGYGDRFLYKNFLHLRFSRDAQKKLKTAAGSWRQSF